MKTAKTLLNITSVFCFIFGALYCFSLVFIPIGVYCFIAGKTFSFKADHLNENLVVTNKLFLTYVVFVSIVCLPFGWLSIIAYNLINNNNVKVDNLKYTKVTEVSEQEKTETTENVEQETESEKQEKLEKLKNFLDKGIISEEEFNMAKDQMFGNKDEENKL